MLCPIDLDYQPQFDTGKAGDEWADRVLAAEFASGKAPIAKPPPKGALGICLVRAEISGMIVGHVRNVTDRR